MSNQAIPRASGPLAPSAGPLTILLASKVDPAAIARLERDHRVIQAFGAPEEELIGHMRDSNVLVFRSGVQITRRVLLAAPNLRLVIRAGSGLDNVHLPTIEELNVRFVRVPEPGARAVAELAFCLMLMLARQVRVADALLREGRWAKSEITGYLLRGKRLGIVGAGNIGAQVGRMGLAWGMDVAGCIEDPTDELVAQLEADGITHTDFDTVLRTSDFVSVHVPLQDSTRNLIDARALGLMKSGAFLATLARGGVVDEDALYDALQAEDGLAGAALDVHAREGEGAVSRLAPLDNVVLTPHIGATTVDTQRQIGERVVELVLDLVRGGSTPVRRESVPAGGA